MHVESADAVSDPFHHHHLHRLFSYEGRQGENLAKRILGFVLEATVDGPPRSPHQTYFAHTAARTVGDRTRQPPPAFHRLRVTARSWRLISILLGGTGNRVFVAPSATGAPTGQVTVFTVRPPTLWSTFPGTTRQGAAMGACSAPSAPPSAFAYKSGRSVHPVRTAVATR